MNTVYRPMHLSDIDNVWEFLEKLRLHHKDIQSVDVPDKKDLKKWLIDGEIFLYIAENGENVLAILKAIRGKDNETRHSAYLSEAIHPDYLNKDIGEKLTFFALEDMKKDGVSIARVNIYSNNIQSITTLLKLGFNISGSIYRHHYNKNKEEYIDEIIFYKLL